MKILGQSLRAKRTRRNKKCHGPRPQNEARTRGEVNDLCLKGPSHDKET